MSIFNNPNTQLLIKVMDLEVPINNYLSVTDYELVDGNIVIKSVEVLDSNGEFCKLADNNKLIEHLHKYPIVFKKKQI